MNRRSQNRAGSRYYLDLGVAAGQEAQFAGRSAMTLDDLLTALLVVGGPAARVLAAHGVNLPRLRVAMAERDDADLASIGVDPTGVSRPERRSIVAGSSRQPVVEMDPAVKAVVNGASSERDLLLALLNHPSGGPAESIRLAGGDTAGILSQTDWPAMPQSSEPAPIPGLLDGPHVTTKQLPLFLAVPFADISNVLVDPHLASEWLVPDGSTQVEGDSVLYSISKRGRTAQFEMHRVLLDQRDDYLSVAWQKFWPDQVGNRPGGYYVHCEATPRYGGTDLMLTHAMRGYGRFPLAGVWMHKLFANSGMRNVAKALIELALRPNR